MALTEDFVQSHFILQFFIKLRLLLYIMFNCLRFPIFSCYCHVAQSALYCSLCYSFNHQNIESLVHRISFVNAPCIVQLNLEFH